MPITLCRTATPFSCSNGLFAKVSGKASFVFVFFQISMDCIVHGSQKMESTQKIYGSRV